MIPHDMITGSISATALQVAAALARHADAKGEAWPSMPTVAARLNVCRNTVVTAVAELEAAGWIERYHRRRVSNQGDAALVPDGPPSTSNLYRLLWLTPEGCDAEWAPVRREVPNTLGREVPNPRAGEVPNTLGTELEAVEQEPVEREPPPALVPTLDSHQEPPEAAGVVVESVPDTPVADLDAERAARFCSEVLDALVRSEYEAAQEAALTNGKPISNPGGYRRGIKQRLVEEGIEAEIVAYQEQYPDDTPDELADRLAPDRSPGARPPSRPTNSVDLDTWATLVATGNPNAAAVLEVLDLPRGG
jgi:hypothetical protein